MRSKNERYEAIKRLINTQSISNQIDLLNLLKQEGFDVTQATLSRDIKQLKIVKSHGEKGDYFYTLPQEEAKNPQGVPVIQFSGNLAVLKTRPGYAMGIASDIDGNLSEGIIGTLAGDDTILLILKENADTKQIESYIQSIIEGR